MTGPRNRETPRLRPDEDCLRAVLDPGEDCSYSELIDRLNAQNLPTNGIGNFIEQFRYKRGSRAEFVTWMQERFWDDEVQGGWSEGSLWIARKP